MNNPTPATKLSSIKRSWYLFDARGKVLGRAATDIALKLMGKDKPYFTRHLDCGNFVVVINAKDVVVTGKKEKNKLYGNYSGYPAGLKQKALWQVRVEKPTEVVKRAVFGMLPKNKLRNRLVKRLYIYPGNEHPYQERFKAPKLKE